MASWYDDYLGALQDRDAREKSNVQFFSYYARLADRTASLKTAQGSMQLQTVQSRNKQRAESPKQAAQSAEDIERLRTDLAEAQRSKELLQSQLKAKTGEVEKLKTRSGIESRQIRELSAERTSLATRVKDRDAELKGKAKLLEEVQDELVSLHLQLNMAEQRCQKLEQDNKDLIERWMARKGREADALNEASKF